MKSYFCGGVKIIIKQGEKKLKEMIQRWSIKFYKCFKTPLWKGAHFENRESQFRNKENEKLQINFLTSKGNTVSDFVAHP